MKKRYIFQCLKGDGTIEGTRAIEFSTEEDRDAAFDLIAFACGKDGERAFSGNGKCSANGYIFLRMTMLDN